MPVVERTLDGERIKRIRITGTVRWHGPRTLRRRKDAPQNAMDKNKRREWVDSMREDRRGLFLERSERHLHTHSKNTGVPDPVIGGHRLELVPILRSSRPPEIIVGWKIDIQFRVPEGGSA